MISSRRRAVGVVGLIVDGRSTWSLSVGPTVWPQAGDAIGAVWPASRQTNDHLILGNKRAVPATNHRSADRTVGANLTAQDRQLVTHDDELKFLGGNRCYFTTLGSCHVLCQPLA